MHIPKTAGSSVRIFLENQYAAGDIFPAEGWAGSFSTIKDVSKYLLVRGHFAFNMSQALPDAKILTILRDPLLRTVSALRHIKRDPNFHALHQVAKDMTLPEMLRNRRIMQAQRNIQTAYLCAATPPAKVLKFISLNPSREASDMEDPPDLGVASTRLKKIEFLGLVEDLRICIDEMSKAMNYHQPAYFPFVNEDPQLSNTLRDLNYEDIGILREANKLDLQLYEYARELLAQRRFEQMMRKLVSEGVYKVPAGSFEIDVGGIIPGSGWYPAEREGEGCWRWTGPDHYFTLEVPLRDDVSYRASLRFNTFRTEVASTLRVRVNGIAVRSKLESIGPTEFDFEFDIDRQSLALSSGFCRMVLAVATERPPGELRKLGVAVNKITFECLDQTG
jgi:hypothetical protein